jgi:uncharacterized protein
MDPSLARRLRASLLALVLALCAGAGCGRSEAHSANAVEVRVRGVAVDERSQSPVVILEERHGPRRLPIWIGFAEADAIASQLQSIEPPRPGTHDLAKRLIDGLEGSIERVEVTDLEAGVYYARIVLARDGRSVQIDARPSDAIALALRFGAPVFVNEALFARSLEGGASDDGQRI